LPYMARLLPGGALPKWLLVRHSNVPEGNSIQQSGILGPTFLPANTTKYISVTSQICHAIAVLSSLSTDCDFLFPFYEPASEGVTASMHRTNLHPTDQMKPCNKRLTSWVYNHQSQVVFLFLKTHINPLSLLQRLYHNISSSSTVTSCTATNTYHVEAEGVSTTSINPVPTKAHVGLFASKEKPKLALNFDYRSITMEREKSNYLSQTSWHNMMHTIHRIAHFSSNLRESYGETILYLACYLTLIIFYAGCLIIWTAKVRLQSQAALSTAEAKYIARSIPLWDKFPIMFLLKGTRETHASYKVFEDNSGALELACLPKLSSRSKHINMCYHHFLEPVRSRLIKICPVSTHDQVAYTLTINQDSLTKHVPEAPSCYVRTVT